LADSEHFNREHFTDFEFGKLFRGNREFLDDRASFDSSLGIVASLRLGYA